MLTLKIFGILLCLASLVFIFYIIIGKSINDFRQKYLIESFENDIHKSNDIISPQKNILGKRVILIGDFIIKGDNSASANISIQDLFIKHKKTLHDKYNINTVRLFTKNCFVSDDIKNILTKIPTTYNTNNTYFFISMGTNDIIKNHSNCNIKPISNCKTPSEISEIWNNNINALIEKFPNSTITVVLNDNINTNESYNHCDSFIKSSQTLKNETKNNAKSQMIKANDYLKASIGLQKLQTESFIPSKQENHPISSDIDKFNKDVNKYIYQHNENNKQTRINVIYLDEIKSRNKYISFTPHIDVPFVYALFDEMTNKFK